MKVVILYRQQSEHARAVTDFIREFERRTARTVEILDIDTKDGADKAKLYDVLAYPAILVMNDDGQLQKSWEGEELPLIDEVMSYAAS